MCPSVDSPGRQIRPWLFLAAWRALLRDAESSGSILLAVDFPGGQPETARCLVGALRGGEERVLGDERPESTALMERLLEGSAKPRGLRFCCGGWRTSPPCDAAGKGGRPGTLPAAERLRPS